MVRNESGLLFQSVNAQTLRDVCMKYIYDQCPVVAAVGESEAQLISLLVVFRPKSRLPKATVLSPVHVCQENFIMEKNLSTL